jgi:hypothetical protein
VTEERTKENDLIRPTTTRAPQDVNKLLVYIARVFVSM